MIWDHWLNMSFLSLFLTYLESIINQFLVRLEIWALLLQTVIDGFLQTLLLVQIKRLKITGVLTQVKIGQTLKMVVSSMVQKIFLLHLVVPLKKIHHILKIGKP